MSTLIPISCLFASMLSFLRMHSDGEWTALLASGYSLRQALLPVLSLSVVLFSITMYISMNLEAWGRREFEQFIYRKTKTEIDNMMKYRIQEGVFVADFLDYVFYTEKISKEDHRYHRVLMAPNRNNTRLKDFLMVADSAEIKGSVEQGDLRMSFANGYSYAFTDDADRTTIVKFEKADIDLLQLFKEKIMGDDSFPMDYRSLSIVNLYQFVKKLEANPARDEKMYLKARYLFHSRIGNPFIVFAFAIFGMILSLGDLRQNRNLSYLGAIATIILSFMLSIFFRWMGEQGKMSALWAVWTPQVIVMLIAIFLLYQKNRLPPSESPFAWSNLPFVRR